MPNRALIPDLLTLLIRHPSRAGISNAYLSPPLLQNLRVYLEGLIDSPSFRGDLLVGEAPGYAGCARTGIPFTSEYVLVTSRHPFLVDLRPNLHCPGRQKERSSSIVWNHLEKGTALPAFWNAFPFHPHPPHDPLGNRKPTAPEARFGADVLDCILRILTPARVFALGRVAEAAISRHLTRLGQPVYIRHPANGGQTKFVAGMTTHRIG